MPTRAEQDFINSVIRALDKHGINAAGHKDRLAADIVFAYRKGNRDPRDIASKLAPHLKKPVAPNFKIRRK
jgi:hypothetical protein